METALALQVVGLILTALSLVFLLFLFRDYKNDFTGLVKLSSALDKAFKDEDTSEMIYQSIDSFHGLGTLAKNANSILADEDAFDGLLTEFAGRVRKSIMNSIMGTASGDVKKKTRAERILNEAMVEGAQKINPTLGLILKVTGLDEELKADPELLGYVLQIVNEKGLLNMLDSSTLALPSVEQQNVVKERLGVDW